LPFEIAAVVAVAIVYAVADLRVPEIVVLFVCATASRWARIRGWGEVAHGGAFAIGVGAAAGALALVAALLAGTPLIETALDRAVEWSTFPIVRGSSSQLVAVMVLVAVSAIATELVIRGWLVERALELGTSTAMAIVLGGVIELVLTPGDLATRLGGLLVGVGMTWMYVAGKRNVVAPAAARVTFAMIALVLESLRLIG